MRRRLCANSDWSMVISKKCGVSEGSGASPSAAWAVVVVVVVVVVGGTASCGVSEPDSKSRVKASGDKSRSSCVAGLK